MKAGSSCSWVPKVLVFGVLCLPLWALPANGEEFEVLELEEQVFRVEDLDGVLRLKQALYDSRGKVVGRVSGLSRGGASVSLEPEAVVEIGQKVSEVRPIPQQQRVGMAARLQTRGWDGMSRVLILSTRADLTQSKASSESSPVPTDFMEQESHWDGALLFHVAPRLWVGPTLGFELMSYSEKSTSYHAKSSGRFWGPGLGARVPIASGMDQYAVLKSEISYSFYSGKYEGDFGGYGNSSSSKSGTRLAYGAGLAFGQRLGSARNYLIELGVDFSKRRHKYTTTDSGETDRWTNNSSRLSFTISIGIGL